MDCPSEENMIRLKLDGLQEIARLDFDIGARRLLVSIPGRTGKSLLVCYGIIS